MDINTRLAISFYKTIAVISQEHKIEIVQHIQTKKIYVKKSLMVYNRSIYEFLLDHPIPHTPRIYEIYEEDGILTIIEEYISGNTLEQLLENHVHFDTEEIRNITIQLCTILSALHHCHPPIIHRDIKPSNIILTPSGELYLLDFNAAKYHSDSKNEDTTLLGTKGYAAPEQYGFGVSSVQTDIYALGMLINTLVTGSFSQEIKENGEFTSIIMTCTKMDAKERYANVDSILHILQKKETKRKEAASDFHDWKSYLPPGFRSLSPFPMFFSFVGYMFIFWLSLTLEIPDTTPFNLYIERFFCLLMFLSVIFCTFNYRNIQSKFPPCKTNNKLLKLLAVALMDFLVFISLMFIMIFIISLI